MVVYFRFKKTECGLLFFCILALVHIKLITWHKRCYHHSGGHMLVPIHELVTGRVHNFRYDLYFIVTLVQCGTWEEADNQCSSRHYYSDNHCLPGPVPSGLPYAHWRHGWFACATLLPFTEHLFSMHTRCFLIGWGGDCDIITPPIQFVQLILW